MGSNVDILLDPPIIERQNLFQYELNGRTLLTLSVNSTYPYVKRVIVDADLPKWIKNQQIIL